MRILKYLKKVNYVLDRQQKMNMLGLLLIILGGAIVELLGVSAILPLVNVALDPTVIETNEMYAMVYNMLGLRSAKEFIIIASVFLIFVYVVKNFYLIEMYNLQYRFVLYNQRKVSVRLLECYLEQDYLYHVSHNVADLQRNITTDVSQFFSALITILQCITAALTCSLLFLFMLRTNIGITLVLFFCFLLFGLIFYKVMKKKQIEFGVQSRIVSGTLSKCTLQAFGGIKEIKVLDREKYFVDSYDFAFKKYADVNRKNQIRAVLPRYIIEMVGITGLLGVLVIQIVLGMEMTEVIRILSVFAVSAMRIMPLAGSIIGNLNQLLFFKAAIDNVYADIKEAEGLCSYNNAIAGESVQFSGEITINSLSFSYPDSNRRVLDNVDMHIKRNTSVAIVGSSGAGKSTLADIIMGVLKPQCGHVLSDGCDIHSDLRSWHKMIGYIPQTIYLMDDTVRANVAFGISQDEIDDDRVWSALRQSQLIDVIENLPEGLESLVGDRGVKLSGGQRQRIGIARALYLNPQILVLDEATSALDKETEQAVMESIESLRGSRTLIIIAHRLTTIEKCDVVYEVTVEGRVVEKKRK